jgi:hypothetical protein
MAVQPTTCQQIGPLLAKTLTLAIWQLARRNPYITHT